MTTDDASTDRICPEKAHVSVTQYVDGETHNHAHGVADLSVYSQAHLNKVARQLNERRRKTLGYETPAERFNACVAATA